MTFAQFMELALYDPELGYYRQNRRRIGYARGTDFFTATTSGTIFGELVSAACERLVAPHGPAKDFTFIEVGAEPGAGILRNVSHPFRAERVVALGENPQIAGRCIVFSNELFDAQPFHRFVFHAGRWREFGVAVNGDQLREVELPAATVAPLPTSAPEGYRLDLSLAAKGLAETLSAPGWSGLFVAADYGKSWRELVEATPSGTARAYYRHAQSNELLAHPGEQDLTCHVCWDDLTASLRQNGFVSPALDSQEAFFIHHAGEFIARTTAAEAGHFSPKKLSLLQLLHPANLGQKFQVLHAWREEG